MCSVTSVPSHLLLKKQTVPQEPEGPSVPSIMSLAEHPVALSTCRLNWAFYLVCFWKGAEEHDTNLLCFKLHGNTDLTVDLEVLLGC